MNNKLTTTAMSKQRIINLDLKNLKCSRSFLIMVIMNKYTVLTAVLFGLLIAYNFFKRKSVVVCNRALKSFTKNHKPSNLDLSFYVVTWNVGTKYPDNLLLNSLLSLEKNAENDLHLPDFFVIGLQEVSSAPQNMVMGLFKDDPWTQKFKELLKLRNYVVVKTEQMQGLLINVFALRKHLTHLREIESEYTRTGLGGIWGNKGGVSIRMNLYGRSVCFVNSHLAAHDHMLEERLNDYDKIVEEHKYHVKFSEGIFNHDYVFWFGDLNFRLTGEATTTPEQIRDMVHNDKLNELLEKDQLRKVMAEERAFTKLTERLPAFPPTFKFEPGTMDYDMKRRPAWTDRILYKIPVPDISQKFELEINQTSYKSHPTYSLSDHKPVSSEFVVKITRNRNKDIISKPIDFPDGRAVQSLSQANDDIDELSIEFATIPTWVIGEENVIEYIVPEDFEELGSDWIGIYKEDFASVSEYLSYEYANRSQSPSADNKKKRNIEITFPDTVEIEEEGQYILIYFQSTGTRGVTGIAGMSGPFKAEKRSASPRLDAID